MGEQTPYRDKNGKEIYTGDIVALEVDGQIREFVVDKATVDREYNMLPNFEGDTVMYTMLEMAVRLEKKYHKKTTLQDLDIEVDVLRNLLRLAKDPNLYPNQKPCLNFHTWEVWMRKVDEIGRMIGGYSEWVNSRERQK